MPKAPKRPCTWPGCQELVEGGSRCPKHTVVERTAYDRDRRDQVAKRFYNSKQWQMVRRSKLARNPCCEMDCKANGIVIAASMVHHIDGNIWNLKADNLQSACASCHSRHEDSSRGGFAPRRG